MNPEEKVDDRAVARGNHLVGYSGVIIRDWDKATEKLIAVCKHRHPTTTKARTCVGNAWFRGIGLEDIHLV